MATDQAQDAEQDAPTLSPDEAISSIDEDELGRAQFAVEVANAIHSWSNTSSLVFALVGPWGNGKSSVKNMVVEALERKVHPAKPPVLQFVPWEWAAQGRIVPAFFEELAAILNVADNSGAGKKRAKELIQYGELLQGAGTKIAGLPATLVALIAAVASLGLSPHASGGLKTLLLVFGLFCAFLAFILVISGWAVSTVGQLKTLGLNRREATLPQRKSKLADLMQTGIPVPPVLVVMDDLDRLDAHELLQTIQLIRANADLPNLVYLLLYEEDIVSKTLDSMYPGGGRPAMQKIVNIPLPIPAVQAGQLKEMAKRRVEKVVGQCGHTLNGLRWANIVESGWGNLIDNMRTINRFLNIYTLHMRMLTSGAVLEVDAGDLAAIDLLSATEPKLHSALRDAKEWLTSDSRVEVAPNRLHQFERLVGLADEGHRSAVRLLLQRLFPQTESFTGGTLGGRTLHASDQFAEWWRDRRICSELAFDIYFTLTNSRGEASGSQVQQLAEAMADKETLIGRLRELSEGNLTSSALRQLRADQIPPEKIQTFLRGLFRAGDEFLYAPIRIPGGPPDEGAAVFAIRRLCRDRLTEAAYVHELIEAMNATQAVYLPTVLTSWETGSDSLAGPLTQASIRALRDTCLGLIRQAALNNRLLETPGFAYVLYRWSEWGDPAEVKQWLRERVKTREDIEEFAYRMGGYHTEGSIADPVHRATFVPSRGDLANLIGPEYLDEIQDRDEPPAGS